MRKAFLTGCTVAALSCAAVAQTIFYGDRLGSGGNTGYLYFEDGKLVVIQRRN